DPRRQAQNGHAGLVPGNTNHVVAVGAIDDDIVGRPVAGARARDARQVEVDLGDAGAGQVADGDLVDAALGGKVDALQAVEVHGDVGDVTGEADPGAVGLDVNLLRDGGAVELERVGPALALDRVVAVARVPHERVVAGAQPCRVVAGSADHHVVA